MDLYVLVKTPHIVSATILFGTGIGIANFMFFGHRSGSVPECIFAARMTVKADFLFTLPPVIVQPISGAWLVWRAGFPWNDYWLVLTYGLYLLAGACWVRSYGWGLSARSAIVRHGCCTSCSCSIASALDVAGFT